MNTNNPVSNEIIVVTLDIKTIAMNYTQWKQVEALDKIDILETHFTKICDEIFKTSPNAFLIITAKEYILEGKSRAVSSVVKEKFKNTMSNLAIKYSPNLLLIPGSLATYKNVAYTKEIFKKKYALYEYFKNKYKENDWLSDGRKYETFNNNPNLFSKEVTLIRNSAMVFYKNEIKVIDKKYPFHECLYNCTLTGELFFQFPKTLSMKNKTANDFPIITVKIPNSEFSFDVLVGICRDNTNADSQNTLIGYVDENKLPLFHVILSDSVDIGSVKFLGKYISHVDTHNINSLVKNDVQDNDPKIKFYNYDLLKNHYLDVAFKPGLLERSVINKVDKKLDNSGCRIL